MGWELGKVYEKNIDPSKYKIGDCVEIISNPDQPTEIIIVQEITIWENPKFLLIVGFVLLIISYLTHESEM